MPTRKKGYGVAKAQWKDIQSKARRDKRNKLALAVLALVVGFLIISGAVRFTQSLFSPWKLSVGQHRSYIWDGEFNINLLIRTNHIFVLSYNPQQEKIVIINIPDETYLDVPAGFGAWQLRAVYELGQSQNSMGGYQLLADTVTDFLAIPIDGFLDLSSRKPVQSAAEIVASLRENPFFMFNLLSKLKTDLTIWELLRLDLKLTGVRFDKVKQLNLDKLGVLDRKYLPDGTPIFTADPVKLDAVLTDLADPVITAEHKSIAVFNATNQPQLALKWARLISNLGGNVIITGNAEEMLKKTRVQGLSSATLKRLRQIFTPGDKIDYSDDTISSRAQINLLLGEDYVNK